MISWVKTYYTDEEIKTCDKKVSEDEKVLGWWTSDILLVLSWWDTKWKFNISFINSWWATIIENFINVR